MFQLWWWVESPNRNTRTFFCKYPVDGSDFPADLVWYPDSTFRIFWIFCFLLPGPARHPSSSASHVLLFLPHPSLPPCPPRPPTPHLFQLASFTVCCLRQNKNLGKFVRRMHFCKQMKPARKSFENSCHWEKNKSNQAETSLTLTPNNQFKKVACYGDFGSSSSTSESDFKLITVAHLMNKTATHSARKSLPERLLLKSHYG